MDIAYNSTKQPTWWHCYDSKQQVCGIHLICYVSFHKPFSKIPQYSVFSPKHCYQFPFRQIIKRYALPFLGSVFNHIQFSLYELFNSTVSQLLRKVQRKRSCQLPRFLFWVSMPRDKSTNQMLVWNFPRKGLAAHGTYRGNKTRVWPLSLWHIKYHGNCI